MNKIRMRREAAGMSQSELARRLGLDSTTVNKWEAGASLPRLGNLIALAGILQCPVGDLLDDAPPQEDTGEQHAPANPDYIQLRRNIPWTKTQETR
ncbi:MAG: helix-turn-helix transcriptional regulator [Lachnospirales bacterium]